MAEDATLRFGRLRRIPPSVWALGLVSLLMDFSSEMIHALLPVYLVGAMGATMAQVGVIEGVAEATASIVKIFSGAVSDWFASRKLLAILGYGLAAVTKPLFPLAPNVGWVMSARFIDRIGKGVRGAPRDALVADVTPPELRGAAFGLRQSLDTVGAFLGPAVAVLVMWLTVDDIRAVFWVAVIPAVLAVAVLALGVREPEESRPARPARFPLHWDELKGLGGDFWLVVTAATLFSLARFLRSLPHPESHIARPSGGARAARAGGDECRLRRRLLSGRGVLGSWRPRHAAGGGDADACSGRRGAGLCAVDAARLGWRGALGPAYGADAGAVFGAGRRTRPRRRCAAQPSASSISRAVWRCSWRAMRPERCGTSTAPPPPSPRAASLRRFPSRR